MTNLDYIAQTLLHIVLRPGFDIDMLKQTDDGETGFSVFWHRPGLNVSWYPIIEIEHGGATIYHREGPENSGENYRWGSFLQEAADFLYDYQYEQQMQIKSISKEVTTE